MLIACGYGHTLVIVGSGKAGKVLACGRGNTGQLGNGDRESKGVFSEIQGPISNKRVISVAAGLAHSLALTEFSCVFVWGAGTLGQLGVGSTKMASTPQVVKGKLEGRWVLLNKGSLLKRQTCLFERYSHTRDLIFLIVLVLLGRRVKAIYRQGRIPQGSTSCSSVANSCSSIASCNLFVGRLHRVLCFPMC
jgi:hypothetical protein